MEEDYITPNSENDMYIRTLGVDSWSFASLTHYILALEFYLEPYRQLSQLNCSILTGRPERKNPSERQGATNAVEFTLKTSAFAAEKHCESEANTHTWTPGTPSGDQREPHGQQDTMNAPRTQGHQDTRKAPRTLGGPPGHKDTKTPDCQ